LAIPDFLCVLCVLCVLCGEVLLLSALVCEDQQRKGLIRLIRG
jgi:hypothetical protein